MNNATAQSTVDIQAVGARVSLMKTDFWLYLRKEHENCP